MADQVAVLFGDEREPVAARDESTEVVDEVRHDLSVIAERRQMDGTNRISVALTLGATSTGGAEEPLAGMARSDGRPKPITAGTRAPREAACELAFACSTSW